MSLAGVCSAAAQAGVPEVAEHARQVEYRVTVLPSLDGSSSGANSLNNLGWAAGASNLPGDQTVHAALWRRDSIVDLGTLGGPNSGVFWPVKNDIGLIAGVAETSTTDPLGEAWSCFAFFPAAIPSGRTCVGVVWEGGIARPLPTLGGNNGFATGANNWRQVVGWAENTVHDPTCVAPQVLQFRAVLWGPGKDQLQELPPLPGDSTSSATALNDRGQVVGISGICGGAVGRFSARHAVLWENGAPTDIGNLGGVAWHTPMAINQWGDVVGFSNHSAADAGKFRPHAFLWTKRDGIRDLGTLPGDTTSQALGINNWRQIVGLSCNPVSGCRGVTWRNGIITDFNTLVAPDTIGTITNVGDINDFGRVAGQISDPSTGVLSAFRAVPTCAQCRDDDSASEAEELRAAQGTP